MNDGRRAHQRSRSQRRATAHRTTALVAPTAHRRRRARRILGLRVLVDSHRDDRLGVRQLPIAVLLAAHPARLLAVLAGAAHLRVPARLPCYLLLLPQGLLPLVLLGSAGLRDR